MAFKKKIQKNRNVAELPRFESPDVAFQNFPAATLVELSFSSLPLPSKDRSSCLALSFSDHVFTSCYFAPDRYSPPLWIPHVCQFITKRKCNVEMWWLNRHDKFEFVCCERKGLKSWRRCIRKWRTTDRRTMISSPIYTKPNVVSTKTSRKQVKSLPGSTRKKDITIMANWPWSAGLRSAMWSPLHRRSRSLHTVDQLLDLDQLSNGSLQCRRCRVSWPATRPERPLISLRNATNFVSCRRPTEPFSSVAEICAKVAGCRGSTSMVSCTVETPASIHVTASCATPDTTPHFPVLRS